VTGAEAGQRVGFAEIVFRKIKGEETTMPTKQTYTMKCRETGHTAKVNVIEVDDVPGHIIGVGEFPGVWSCDDGSVAITSTKDMFDCVKGSGKIHAYNVATFDSQRRKLHCLARALHSANQATCPSFLLTRRFTACRDHAHQAT
jgi:hypothetical protein